MILLLFFLLYFLHCKALADDPVHRKNLIRLNPGRAFVLSGLKKGKMDTGIP
jgi:hypothetical protein